MLEVRNLSRIYPQKHLAPVRALDGVSIKFPETGMVFLLGKSGSGKSTLLNVAGGLDKYDGGEIIVRGKSSRDFSSSDFDSYRNTYIGFIFQEYNILDDFTVSKNIALALELQGKVADRTAVHNILEQVDMAGYGDRKPNQLSGGQKQRVAIARALVKDPQIIMADEPTGALDSVTGKQVFETLKNLSKNRLVLVVSHDRDFAETYGDRIIELKDGKVLSDETKRLAPIKSVSDKVTLSGDTLFIEPGHTLNQQEKDFIIESLLSKSGEAGAVISLDNRINKDFKKFAKMDEEGNREYFSDTQEDDVSRSSEKSFKLIKSRFKYVDSLKMGASGLKIKKVRLAFTILLSALALMFFGVADTAASFNAPRAMYDSIQAAGIRTIGVTQRQGRWNIRNITEDAIEHLREQFPDYSFLGAHSVDRIQLNFYSTPRGDAQWYYMNTETVFSLTEQRLSGFGLTLKPGGRMPLALDEVVITDYQFDAFRSRGLAVHCPVAGRTQRNINVPTDIHNQYLRFTDYRRGVEHILRIVGVLETGFDFGRYQTLRQGGEMGGMMDWMLM